MLRALVAGIETPERSGSELALGGLMSVAGVHRFRSVPIVKTAANWTVAPNLAQLLRGVAGF